MDKTISMANNRFFIFFVSSSGCIASASTPGKPAVDLLRRFLRPARNKGNLVPPQILLADLPGTHRTAAAFVAGAGVDHGFPHVVLRAPPPHLLVASRGETMAGVKAPFRTGSHVWASSGYRVARSLNPARTFRPAQ